MEAGRGRQRLAALQALDAQCACAGADERNVNARIGPTVTGFAPAGPKV